MNTTASLPTIIEASESFHGSWKDAQLALDIKSFMWEQYDPNDNLTYPNTTRPWADLLKESTSSNNYDNLTKDEVLSILFGLIHHNRIVDGAWESMLGQGITQKLLKRLLALDTD